MDQGVESQVAFIQQEREMPKKLLSQLLFKHGPQHQNNNKRTTPSPKCCLVFQRHHTVMEKFAQLRIWFRAKSQMGTVKVRENKQLSPGRQRAPSWQPLLTVH